MFEEAARRARYMAYTKSFDKEVSIGDLVDAETVERLERYFEFRGFEMHEDAMKAAIAELEGSVSFPEGTAVTLLVEMSGSMNYCSRLRRVSLAVLAAAELLERNGVAVEVLGFTTSGDGRPQRMWNADKTITYPGRLSELRHVVVKPFAETAARSVGRIQAIAANGLHHENIDGEALIWAANRLLARHDANRVLSIVTDADEPQCAVSQRFADDRDFLARHHREVVQEIETSDELDFVPVIVAGDINLRGTYADPVVTDDDPAAVLCGIVRGLALKLEPTAERAPLKVAY